MIAVGVTLVALAVVVVGLVSSGRAAPPTPDERAYQLETRLKCPFCVGESLASSQSGVARDLRVLIERRIAEGATDDEIIQEFVTNYGESILLEPPTRSWGLALWIIPILIVGVGVVVVVRLRRPEPVARR